MAVNSMSSRSFRELVLTRSIMSVFGKKSTKDSPSSSRQTSDASADTMELITMKRGGGDGEEIVTGVKSKDEENNINTTLTNSLDEGETAPFRGKVNPFAGGVEGGVSYMSMSWWQAGMVMVAETISLGILSLAQALSKLGLIPGTILLVVLGFMASYTGFVIGQLKIRYPHIHSMGDAGEVLFGVWGREILGLGQLLFVVFIMASHILTFSIAMNAMTGHAACTIVFMVVGTIVSFVFTLPRTLKNLSYYSIASFISIIGAVFVTIGGVAAERPGFHLDAAGQMVSTMTIWPQEGLTFSEGFLAVANIVFAYAGHAAFFGFISELKEPKDFPKALAFLQISDITLYIICAVVVYYFAGETVASPALDSTGPLIRKIAYGVALPTIVIAGVVNGHVAVKYVYVRLFRHSEEDIMHQKTFKARGYWTAICFVLWAVAYLIAEGVPVFNDLLGLTSALFASWFTFGLSGMFWIHMNLKKGDCWWKPVPRQQWTWKKSILLLINILNVLVGATICFVGLYASGKSIANNTSTNKPFTCANNARHVS